MKNNNISNLNWKDNKTLSKLNVHKKNLNDEFDFLNKIYDIENKLFLNFAPLNWPKGYNGDIYFYTYITFNSLEKAIEKDYYEVRIFQDIYAEECHNVYFIKENKLCTIMDIYKLLHYHIPKVENSIYYELELLELLNREQLTAIGHHLSITDKTDGKMTLFDEYQSLIQNKIHRIKPKNTATLVNESQDNSNTTINVIPYIKLFDIKHGFQILKKVINNDSFYIEGIIKLPIHFTEYGWSDSIKSELYLRIYSNRYQVFIRQNNTIDNYKTLSNILDKPIDNEFYQLFSLSTLDLELILKEVSKSLQT